MRGKAFTLILRQVQHELFLSACCVRFFYLHPETNATVWLLCFLFGGFAVTAGSLVEDPAYTYFCKVFGPARNCAGSSARDRCEDLSVIAPVAFVLSTGMKKRT